jgi:hypothetical protein
MLPVLLEQNHRQQARAGPTPSNYMERRRSLADLLAVAAGELLADMLDHLPLPRDHLQRLGDILAQLAQPRATAALANGRSRLDHPLARQVLGEGLARRTLADKRHPIGGLGDGPLGDDLVLSRRTLDFLERQLHLIEQPHRAFRALAIELARQLGDLQLLMGDHSLIVGGLGLGHRQFRLDPGRPGRLLDALCALHDQRRLQRGDVIGGGLRASSARARLSHIAAAEPLHRDRPGQGLSRLWLAALRGGLSRRVCVPEHDLVEIGRLGLRAPVAINSKARLGVDEGRAVAAGPYRDRPWVPGRAPST